MPIEGVALLTPRRFEDDRGWFCETWNARTLAGLGLELDFVQDNHSLSRPRGTVRGLHFQLPPHGQGKLVRVIAGAVRDVAVDIRVGSPTYGRHVAVDLSAENGRMLWVPEGFAHGFATLVPDTEVVYKVTGFYDRDSDRGLRFDDPALGIDWGIRPEEAVLSPKDRTHPTLAELGPAFRHVPPAG